MSIDKSLKSNSATAKHRNVLRRAERIGRLQDEGHWQEGQGAHGLVKVANRKLKVGGKVKKKAEEGGEAKVEAEPKT